MAEQVLEILQASGLEMDEEIIQEVDEALAISVDITPQTPLHDQCHCVIFMANMGVQSIGSVQIKINICIQNFNRFIELRTESI
jgi:hypothetical protein